MGRSESAVSTVEQAEGTAAAQRPKGWFRVRERMYQAQIRQRVVPIALVVLCIGFAIITPQFLSVSNFANIGRQTAIVSVVAFAMTFAFTAGEFDLSVGSVIALASMAAALTLQAGGGTALASLAGIATGAAGGVIIALLVTKAGIPSFLVTLGYLSVARGIALTVTQTNTVVYDNPTFNVVWGARDIAGVPGMVLWTIAALAFFYVLFNFTAFGRYAQATGGNKTAALFSGINTARIKALCLLMTGTAAGIGGLLMTARMGVGRPYVAQGMELDIIAAVILGGTSLSGGKGTIIGTLIGALLMGVINNGLVLAGMGAPEQMFVKGAIIIGAVFFAEKNA